MSNTFRQVSNAAHEELYVPTDQVLDAATAHHISTEEWNTSDGTNIKLTSEHWHFVDGEPIFGLPIEDLYDLSIEAPEDSQEQYTRFTLLVNEELVYILSIAADFCLESGHMDKYMICIGNRWFSSLSLPGSTHTRPDTIFYNWCGTPALPVIPVDLTTW